MLRKNILLRFGATSTRRSRNFYVILSRYFDYFVISHAIFANLYLSIVYKLKSFKARAIILSRIGMTLNYRMSREDRKFKQH